MLFLALSAGAACSAADKSENPLRRIRQATINEPGECDPPESESMELFAQKCDDAVGETVPEFDCNAGTLVPTTIDGVAATQTAEFQGCDRPNVLNHQCDPGSRFQVLKETADVAIVAHCRKQGLGDNYGDVAVIQYNKKNGSTCFYQALGNLGHIAPKPTDGTGGYWKTPTYTREVINCVRCHDNGAFVRSPYLEQLKDEPVNHLPGTYTYRVGGRAEGPFDMGGYNNKVNPYKFVGADFQGWKAYSVTQTGSMCTNCHRMGMNSSVESGVDVFSSSGTARSFGIEATSVSQTAKLPHGVKSPIWMLPGQITYDADVHSQAVSIADCSHALRQREVDPDVAVPDGCNAVRFAQGDTCKSGPIRGTVNGATKSTPTESGRIQTGTIGEICTEGECPPGFCYWRTLHGPFWQLSDHSVPPDAEEYVGGLARIYAESGQWKWMAGAQQKGLVSTAPAGGTFECTGFGEIDSVPQPHECGARLDFIESHDSTSNWSDSLVLGTLGDEGFGVLTGFIGNVAVSNDLPDSLAVDDFLASYRLWSEKSAAPSWAWGGPSKAESWTNSCHNWVPVFEVKNVSTASDVQLVPASRTRHVRCFLTGISGNWWSTRDGGATQPYAEIYLGPAGDTRLRVFPQVEAGEIDDRVSASASCIQLRL